MWIRLPSALRHKHHGVSDIVVDWLLTSFYSDIVITYLPGHPIPLVFSVVLRVHVCIRPIHILFLAFDSSSELTEPQTEMRKWKRFSHINLIVFVVSVNIPWCHAFFAPQPLSLRTFQSWHYAYFITWHTGNQVLNVDVFVSVINSLEFVCQCWQKLLLKDHCVLREMI